MSGTTLTDINLREELERIDRMRAEAGTDIGFSRPRIVAAMMLLTLTAAATVVGVCVGLPEYFSMFGPGITAIILAVATLTGAMVGVVALLA